jgi:hypothetical protein
MELTLNEKLVIEELRRSFELNDNSSNVLDQKANSILSNTSVIIGIFMTLHIAIINYPKTIYYWIGIIVLMMLYFMLVLLCTSAFWPTDYKRPIKINWETISMDILDNKKKNIPERLISSYINSINYNKLKNERKVVRIRISSFVMFLLVCIIGIISTGFTV